MILPPLILLLTLLLLLVLALLLLLIPALILLLALLLLLILALLLILVAALIAFLTALVLLLLILLPLVLLPLLIILILILILILVLTAAPLFVGIRRSSSRLRKNNGRLRRLVRLGQREAGGMGCSEAGQAGQNSARHQQTPKLCHLVSCGCEGQPRSYKACGMNGR